MRLVFASDHGGYELKKVLVAHAAATGHQVEDLGVHGAAAADYPGFARQVARTVRDGNGERGILVCGTGIGMAIVANRCSGIRAALCHDAFTAEASRRHNDANVLCLGGRTTGPGVACQILDIFLNTPFDGGRHLRRLEQIDPKESP